MKLSLCLATYNEEKFIHYPLDSAYDLVDEVIIVDGGSTDKTLEIAASYGNKVKIIKSDNPPMFHINKQKAIEAARGEWIIQLDADESLSEDLQQEIVNLLQIQSSKFKIQNSHSKFEIPDSKFIAYNVPRKNYFLGRFLMKGGVYPDYTIRLYKNGSVRFPCKSVHENVELINSSFNIPDSHSKFKILDSKFKIGYLKSPILHYADPNFKRYLKRWDRYNTLEAKELQRTFNVQRLTLNVKMFIDYIFIKPISWFFNTYFRHLGFLDGWQGLVFHFMSSIRFWLIYFKYLKLKKNPL